jgi:hypothetical protein
LAIASAAVQTAGDVMARWYVNYTGTDSGLRGGHWSWVQPGNIATFTLKEVRWTTDLAVSGSLVWNQITGDVQTQLQFSTDDGTAGTLVAHWNDHESTVAARLDGTIEGQTVVASMPPP